MAKQGFVRKGRFFVYIVKCRDNSFYTGFTPDLKRRVKLHNAGRGAKYTRDRRPVKLVWHKKYKYFKLAFMEERRIKTFTREQKENLIKGVKKAPRLKKESHVRPHRGSLPQKRR